mmetsp:Transcript_51386/g.122110  ORF Transcript_51386/g.122110 Transcript_51386/m.122110 type:complete len:874 (-) Transcript_51386:143-2764(-)
MGQGTSSAQQSDAGSLVEGVRVDAAGALLLSGRQLGVSTLELAAGQLPLENIQTLALDGNSLAHLPVLVLERLSPQLLRSLWLDANLLTELPASIGALRCLERLHVADNKLSCLPPEIGELSSLVVLNVSRNKLVALPDELGKCTSLERMWFSGNELLRLPETLGTLCKLRTVWLEKNRLVSLPSCCGGWELLEELQLSGNNGLEILPDSMGLCSSLSRLGIKGCEALRVPPSEVRSQGAAAVVAFLRRRLEQGSAKCWCARWMFVGFERVGKTSLSRALRGEPFNPSETSTDGLGLEDLRLTADSIKEWLGDDHANQDFDIPSREDGGALEISMWDMAGQNLYYLTHDFFLSNRATYILLWRCDKSPPPEARGGTDDHAKSWSVREDGQRLSLDLIQVEHWLACLAARAPGANVIVVGTHAETKAGQLTARLPASVAGVDPEGAKELRQRHPLLNLRFHVVDSSTAFGIPAVKKSIMQLTFSGSSLRLPVTVPRAWLGLRHRCAEESMKLQQMVPQPPPLLNWADFQTLCGTGCPRLAEAVELWHELGDLWHFQGDDGEASHELNDFVVLQPQWLGDALRCIVTQTGATDLIRSQGGIVTLDWLGRRFAEVSVDSAKAAVLLQRLELALPWHDGGAETFLLPGLLPRREEDRHDPQPAGEPVHTRQVRLRLPKGFQPSGLFPRLLLRCVKALRTRPAAGGMWLYDAHMSSADGALSMRLTQRVSACGAAELGILVGICESPSVDGPLQQDLIRERDDLLRGGLAEAAALVGESFPGLLPTSSEAGSDNLAQRASLLFCVPCYHCDSVSIALSAAEEEFRQQREQIRCPDCAGQCSLRKLLGQMSSFSATTFRPMLESSVISVGLVSLLRNRC